MNRTTKRSKGVCILVCILLCMLLGTSALSGCGVVSREDTTSKAAGVDAAEVAQQIEDGMFIMLYMLNEDSWDTEITSETENADAELTTTVVAEISEKDLNAATIVDKYNTIVVQSLYGEMFSVNAVTTLENKVTVDFDSESVANVGIADGEAGALFYNLARSIDENLGDVNAIFFTMDGGEDFRLGHLWFAATEPFYTGRGIYE